MYLTLKRSLPTLADVTVENVRDWVETSVHLEQILDASWTTPPDQVVLNVGRHWVYFIVCGATEHLIQWLCGPAREHLDAGERVRVVHLLEEATPRLPWRLTVLTIPAIRRLGRPGEREYFDRLANDPGLHEKTRAEAEHACRSIDRKNAAT